MATIMQCSYINCKNDSLGRPMFSFPSVADSRHKAWVQNCGNKSLRDCTQWEFLHKYVCLDHFDKSLITYIISARGLVKNILSADAIPTPYTETTSKDIASFKAWDCAPVFNEARYAGMGLNAVTIQDVASLQPEDYEVIESENNDFENLESRLTGGECYQGDCKQEIYKCNICFRDIIGFRYRCCTCRDFDICASCEARGVHPMHFVLRIPVHYSPNEVGDVLEAVRLALIHTRTNEPLVIESSNDEMETVDPFGNGCIELSQSQPMCDSEKGRKEKNIKIEYSPPKQSIGSSLTKPLSNKPLVDNPQDQKDSLAARPPKNPPGCLRQLPANMLPPANAIIKKIRIGPPQDQLASPPKKPVKLKLVGKKKYLPVALDAMRRKAAIRLPRLPDGITKGIRVLVPNLEVDYRNRQPAVLLKYTARLKKPPRKRKSVWNCTKKCFVCS